MYVQISRSLKNSDIQICSSEIAIATSEATNIARSNETTIGTSKATNPMEYEQLERYVLNKF